MVPLQIIDQATLYCELASQGRKFLKETGFARARGSLSQYDVSQFGKFLNHGMDISPHCNGNFKCHMSLATRIGGRFVEALRYNDRDVQLTAFQILSHDIGRLITHEIITTEEAGDRLLSDIGLHRRFIDLHYGWWYWASDDFKPLLRCERDRIVTIADYCGKPSATHPGVRTLREAIESVSTLPTRYNGNCPPQFYHHVDMVIGRCQTALREIAESFQRERGIDIEEILSSIQ